MRETNMKINFIKVSKLIWSIQPIYIIITIIVIIPSAPMYAALYANEYNTALLKNSGVYTAKNIQPDKNEKKNLPAIPAI